MIATLLRIGRINLRRDRVAQMMMFVMPVAFFSIFALIFGRQGGADHMPRVSVAMVDQDHSEASRELIAALRRDASLSVRESTAASPSSLASPAGPRTGNARIPIDRGRALQMVRDGEVPVAVVLPPGWHRTFPNLEGAGARAEILADPSDPVARGAVVGMLQRAGARRLIRSFAGSSPGRASGDDQAGMPVPTTMRDVAGPQRRDSQRMISYYAAGIVVMFLLFSCAAGGGALLDEQDSGTLERVLNTNVGMTRLLAGKWLHLTLLGILQVAIMFTWGMLAFGLDLLHHLPGFAIMTIFTAAAASAFGLILATLSRSRPQLMGFANLLILPMSALGGSMFLRILMNATMQKIGLFTFNAWAIDGYLKVFWREAPLVSLVPQLAVLSGLTVVFLATARLLARRWEAI